MQLPERFHECLGATSACPEVTWRSEVRHCFGVIEARSVLAQVGEKHRDSASRATQFELSPASSTGGPQALFPTMWRRPTCRSLASDIRINLHGLYPRVKRQPLHQVGVPTEVGAPRVDLACKCPTLTLRPQEVRSMNALLR